MTIVTLLTDFGEKDGFTGMMKGVIWSIAPHVQIADLTHEIEPQNIRQAAIILSQAAPYFPDGSIHVAVVDPGVGTSRRSIALAALNQYFVGPDNGIFSLILRQAEDRSSRVAAVSLDKPDFWLPMVSRSFHGRDIFSPVAAHIANGRALNEMGTPLHEDDLVSIQVPAPVRTTDGWQGEIIAIDHFGNLITNLNEQHLLHRQRVNLKVGSITLTEISQTFGSSNPGDIVAMVDSSGQVAIAVVNGNAAASLNAKVGDPITLIEPHRNPRESNAG